MKNLQHVRTRRQLLRVTALGSASFPFLALARKSASAQRHTRTRPTTNKDHRLLFEGYEDFEPFGHRLVQELQIGDEVHALAGRKTIKWIGYNKFTKEERRAWQDSVMPIRVGRFAIDDQTPYRDLYLSPLHCVFFKEAPIPVMYLINEASIAQGTLSAIYALEYYHVELDTHEVIYAEGALVESYDGRNRENFSNLSNTSDFMGSSVNPR